jgi:hypothetical protein
MLLQAGRMLPRHRDDRSYLAVEALIAARRHEDVAGPMHGYTTDHAGWLAGLVEAGQAGGELDPGLSPDAVAHFCLLLAFGSSLLTDQLHAVDEAAWSALLERVVGALLPAPAGHQVRPSYQVRRGANGGTREMESEVVHGRTQEPDGCTP